MIIFVSDRKHNVTIGATPYKSVAPKLRKMFQQNSLLGFDTETTGIDPYISIPLLYIIGTKEIQYVIDVTNKEVLMEVGALMEEFKDDVTFIGANLKFDYKFCKVNSGNELLHMYDIMVAEQRLFQNMTSYKYSLPEIQFRHLKIPTSEMDKSIRMEFVGGSSNFIFRNKHITYGAGDIVNLFDIRDKQMKWIIKYDMLFLLEEIEFKLINVLAEAELEGFKLDTEPWLKAFEENKEAKHQKEIELDNEFRRLREKLCAKHMLPFLTGGKYDRERRKPIEQINMGLFGEPVTQKALTGVSSKPKQNPGNISYTSEKEITEIFAKLGQFLPTKSGKSSIPVLIEVRKSTKGGKTSTSYALENDYEEFTTGKDALKEFLIINPRVETVKFINLIIEHRKITKVISTYGENFIKKYTNPVTGNVHTIFRQCSEASDFGGDKYSRSPVNGRLSSGNAKNGYFNGQNIPRDTKFRHCFKTDEGYDIITSDLSGAEVMVMADKADDPKLLELANSDIHSHMATQGWRNIYKNRSIATFDPIRKHELLLLANEFTISKKENKEMRQPAKNLTFGSVYGCHSKKAGKTLNIPQTEGQIYIDTVKKEIPATFAMVEDNVNLALKQGYLILNERTNSRIWFEEIIKINRRNKEIRKHNSKYKQKSKMLPIEKLDFFDKVAIEGQARNIPISGTQADLLKETMVVIYWEYFRKKKIDAKILLQVHDELVIRYNKDIDKIEYEGEMISPLEFTEKVMCDVSNRYMNTFKMGADAEVHEYWTK